jgi:hypothetical protein
VQMLGRGESELSDVRSTGAVASAGSCTSETAPRTRLGSRGVVGVPRLSPRGTCWAFFCDWVWVILTKSGMVENWYVAEREGSQYYNTDCAKGIKVGFVWCFLKCCEWLVG